MDSVITADDDAFVARFHRDEIANDGFHHRDHLRLAWVAVQRMGLDRSVDAITQAIRHFAAAHGSEGKYHETMTRFWIRVINLGVRRHPQLRFESLLEAEPHLLDKALPFRHWSRELISSPAARTSWIDPDLRPLPD